jgi:DNA polymerase
MPSATREDLLAELGLLPQWRLRAHPGLGAVTARPAAASVARSPAPTASKTAATVDPVRVVREPRAGFAAAPATDGADQRLARIAALDWSDFAADVDACTACKLCSTRHRSVPGVGDVTADWLFVGEAPGAEEDARGEPFVGQAGRLLDNMLAALGLARGNRVYIANVLKCRPPGNRTPEPREVDACLPYLDRQIELIAPRLIVALGKSAATSLLNVDATIGSLRGRVHRYRDVPLIVTYHPAYLLRNLPDKAKAWEDLLLARRTIAALPPTPQAS